MHELTSAAVALMVCVAAGSYLAGCCNGAIITSFLFYHDDIRKHGSHNAGLTNFYRVYGGKFAVCVILIDMLKAFVAVKLGSIVFGEYLGLRLEGEYFSGTSSPPSIRSRAARAFSAAARFCCCSTGASPLSAGGCFCCSG